MKIRFTLIIVIIISSSSISFIACKKNKDLSSQQDSVSINENGSEYDSSKLTAKELEDIGYKHYNSDYSTAIDAFNKAAQIYTAENNFKSAAFMHTNISNLYRDGIKDIDAAINNGLSALSFWRKEGNLLQQANTLKDVGLLQGEAKQTSEALNSLKEALDIFKNLNNKDAIAITEHNIAATHFYGQQYEIAEKHIKLAQNHWKTKNNISRLFNNNILLIKIYKQLDKVKKMESLITECEAMKSNYKINNYAEQRYLDVIQNFEKR